MQNNLINEQLKTWEVNVEYAEPFAISESWDMTEAYIARRELDNNHHLLIEEQRQKLKEIDQKALEVYYRNLNNPNKNITQLIFESIVEDYILGRKDDKNRD